MNSPQEVDKELRLLFQPYNYYKETFGPQIIFRPFVCLSSPADGAVPNSHYKDVLEQQGLGLQIVSINTTATVRELRYVLAGHFPKLHLSPFEFLKSTSITPGHPLEILGVQEQDCVMKLFQSASQIVYVRPLWSIV